MLRVSRLADYAVNLVAHFSRHPEVTYSATEASVITNLQLPTVRKVMKLLAKTNILTASRGLNGGYILTVDIDSISLADVIEAVDGPIAILDCIDSTDYSCSLPACSLKPHWETVNKAIRETLAGIMINDFMTQKHNEIYISIEDVTNV
ncbi:MAG: FeS assembly SUF system regulator [Francisellaceae bacterium]|jgi:FeS assembly SUF system regulator